MGGSRIYDRVDCDVDFEDPAEQWMNGTMPKLACVDSDGAFQADLVDDMVAYSSGNEVDAGPGPAEDTGISQVAAMGIPQAAMTSVVPRPHQYTGYKQNSYCVKCGKYCFHWHGASPNNPDLYPDYECKDCGYVRKMKIA